MAYFSRFPVIVNYEVGDRHYDMMDITRRTGFDQETIDNEAYSLEHTISDGETPIILADRLYNDSDLYWVILLFNNIHDIEADWPMDQVTLLRYCERVYEDPYAIKHYESISEGFVVDADWPEYDRVSIRYIDYETRMNDKKRSIKVPTPTSVSALVREHNRLIKQ